VLKLVQWGKWYIWGRAFGMLYLERLGLRYIWGREWFFETESVGELIHLGQKVLCVETGTDGDKINLRQSVW
jgi:hypothetical protein